MKIALDYDDTYSADPVFWMGFIGIALGAGHEVRCVTARDDRFDRTAPLVALEAAIPVIYTRGAAKKWFVERHPINFHPDWWIDDKPQSVFENSPFPPDDLAKWRVERDEGPSIPMPCDCGGACSCR